jgi:chitin synthase
MACVFLSERLAGPLNSIQLNRSAISPAVMPEGANVSVDSKNGMAGPGGAKKLNKITQLNKSARSLASTKNLKLTSTFLTTETAATIHSLFGCTQIGP